MLRVLEILPTLNVCGGVENYLMNYYRRLDRDDIRVDFAVHGAADDTFTGEILARGDRVFVLPPFTLGGLSRVRGEIDRLFSENGYDLIHCHQANGAYFYFRAAKKHGITHRLLHSHQAAAADRLTHKLRNYPLLALGRALATDNIACSRLAGDWLFGKRPYVVVNNAVEAEKFRYDPALGKEVRRELGIPEGAFTVGHIGRFCNQKNQPFLVDIFREVLSRDPEARLVLVGDGETRDTVTEKIAARGLSDRVILTGVRTDTARLYQAFDAFVMPSLYEGLPVVGIEAQAAGLPVLLSDRVTRETAILDTTRFVPLAESAAVWADALLKCRDTERRDTLEDVTRAGFNIENEAKNLALLYHGIAGK